jgi:hypothetical protein
VAGPDRQRPPEVLSGSPAPSMALRDSEHPEFCG